MKIHMEAVTLLSVLFATSSVLAADDNDAQQQDRRLNPNKKGKRMKKSVQTNAPTTTTTTTSMEPNTKKFRIIFDAAPTVLSAVTLGPDLQPVPSIIGTRSTATGRVFNRDDVTVGEGGELEITANDTESTLLYTQLCTITKGTFPGTIETNSCDFSLCLNKPQIGGCIFYKSGGNFPFTFLEVSSFSLPPVVATKTGGNGVIGFDSGPSFFQIFSSGIRKVLDLDLTTLPSANIDRNVMLANTVPGFCPSEAGGDAVCLGGMGEDFVMPSTPMTVC